jgi:site-specific recombinase XerD
MPCLYAVAARKLLIAYGGSSTNQTWIDTDKGGLASLGRQAREFAAAAKAGNTLRAYQADWNDFREWCEAHQVTPLPATPETVALYLTDRAATLKTSSLARRLTTINRAHQAAGQPSPATMQNAVVSEVWKGIKRKKGTAQHGKKPFLTLDLRRIIAGLPEDLQGVRDRALLLAGVAGGFRRSELAALRVEDLESTPDGLIVRLGRSKTDQEGQGRAVALPYGSDPLTCPVRALQAWLERAGVTAGPLFRAVDRYGLAGDQALHADSVGYLVKRAAGRAGLETAEYAGHSLRAGLATQAAMNGARELAIMKQTGHRSLNTVRKYIREGSLFRDNAATKLGL